MLARHISCGPMSRPCGVVEHHGLLDRDETIVLESKVVVDLGSEAPARQPLKADDDTVYGNAKLRATYRHTVRQPYCCPDVLP